MPLTDESYLGDGVYASWDGYHIWLDTRAQRPVNRIALDPSVLVALNHYVASLRAAIEKNHEQRS
jgi:hypothetical protein